MSIVRPLEWRPVPDGRCASGYRSTEFIAGIYRVSTTGVGWRVKDGSFTFLRQSFPTLEEAKEAAQTDHEARILDAVAPHLAALTDRVKQLEEALRPFAEAAEKYSAIWAEQTGGQEEADHDDEPVQFLGWLGSHIDMATLGDFRRAAALLNGGSNEPA